MLGTPTAKTIASDACDTTARWNEALATFRARIGDEVFDSWFNGLQLVEYAGGAFKVSVPTKFSMHRLKKAYEEDFRVSLQGAFGQGDNVDVTVRTTQPQKLTVVARRPNVVVETRKPHLPATPTPLTPQGRTFVGRIEGSPLDRRYTLDNFAVGACNQLAHAAALQVVDDVTARSQCNPLYVRADVGLGKTHLLQAIAWKVRQRSEVSVLYLTAERFRYQLVEAIKSASIEAFKETIVALDILLVDDLEFLHGQRTEQEFEHVINTLLNNGKQVVVASARSPGHLESFSERLRSRLHQGLVAEMTCTDSDVRRNILENRVRELQTTHPSFVLSEEVIELFAGQLVVSGRELESAITRAYLSWSLKQADITIEIAETIVRDVTHGLEPRRVKIEDIQRVVSHHFAVSKHDMLSQQRHRSVVRPRQVGMYLAKHLTSRSLPEIGRRFGDRDHTTVIHAIRKITNEADDNPRFKEEIELLKKKLQRA